jgi:Ni,Fe-hydrogenase I large subunit
MARLVIDPVTRVGGHLRIEAEVAAGQVTDAWSSGTMFRGIELVLRGRDPRDAWMFAERICGTCTGVHALASVRAVERAFGLTVPRNARLVRNLLAGTLAVRDHVVQFYLAQLPDWADMKAASGADPAATSALARAQSAWPQSSTTYFSGVRDRLSALMTSGQPGPYGNGYWGHPAYRLSPEQSLLLAAHGLEALDWQRKLMRIHTLFGGRDPHPQSYLVGGMSIAAPWGGPPVSRAREHPPMPERDAPMALSEAGLVIVADLLASARTFADQVFMPDVLMLAKAYPDWGAIGAGVGSFLSYGEFPEGEAATAPLLLPQGRIIARDLAKVAGVSQANVAETVAHAWYAYRGGDGELLAPAEGETTPAAAGPAVPLKTLDGTGRYSWLKTPRYDGTPKEVGPLARMLVGWVDGQADIRSAMAAAMATLGYGPDALFGTLGRLLARAVETRVVAGRTTVWLQELGDNLASGDLAMVDPHAWDPSSWPRAAEGWSLGEGPRGAVGHWVSVRDGVVEQYQVVDATTWNASPRDATGVRGPIEAALVGLHVADPPQPLEVLRTVHAFNPCTACAVHALNHRHEGPLEILVRPMETDR